MTRHLLAWLTIAVVGVSTLVFAAVDQGAPTTNADRAYELAKDFACPVCQGQSIAESDVVVARNIHAKFAPGSTKAAQTSQWPYVSDRRRHR